jgi:hypothetical protein
MDKLNRYREIVCRIIAEYASHKPVNGNIASEAVIDRDHDHYQVMQVGWEKTRRVHGCVIHLDIIDGKIWIQHDGTNRPVADELLAADIPPQDIVLGFHPASLRHHTEFAVG